MHFLEHFYLKTSKYDLINKFLYKDTKKLPKLKKIILNFGCQTSDIKNLASSLLALELITNQKGSLTRTKRSNILLKIRKGHPTGCKITLRKNKLFNFFFRLIVLIFPRLKNFDKFKLTKKIKKNFYSFELSDTFNFDELEKHYYLFNNIPKLHVTIVTNIGTTQELCFLLNSFKFPFKTQV